MMQPFLAKKMIVVDDEYWSRKGVERICSRKDSIDIVGSFSSVNDTLEFVKNNNVDIALIDIVLPEYSGFILGDKLTSLNNKISIIYFSAEEDNYYKSDMSKCAGFLLKPFAEEELLKILDRICIKTNEQQETSDLKTKDIISGGTKCS